jgi:hypothetical protein
VRDQVPAGDCRDAEAGSGTGFSEAEIAAAMSISCGAVK